MNGTEQANTDRHRQSLIYRLERIEKRLEEITSFLRPCDTDPVTDPRVVVRQDDRKTPSDV